MLIVSVNRFNKWITRVHENVFFFFFVWAFYDNEFIQFVLSRIGSMPKKWQIRLFLSFSFSLSLSVVLFVAFNHMHTIESHLNLFCLITMVIVHLFTHLFYYSFITFWLMYSSQSQFKYSTIFFLLLLLMLFAGWFDFFLFLGDRLMTIVFVFLNFERKKKVAWIWIENGFP